jgi:hypothetical protein
MEPKILSRSNVARNIKSPPLALSDVVKLQQDQRLPTKNPLPPITSNNSQQNDEYENVDDGKPDIEVIKGHNLPLKLFDGKKQSLDQLNAESMTYIWLRRIKEIFLHMDAGTNDKDDPFIEFDMNLAKTDMANTCDRYMENERITTMKQVCSRGRKQTSVLFNTWYSSVLLRKVRVIQN